MSALREAVGLSLLVLGCSAGDLDVDDATHGPVAPVPVFAREDVESDLALALTQAVPAPFEDQRNPRLEVTLENRSPAQHYAIVLPDDGSEVGWREPHIGFIVEGAAWGGEFSTVGAPKMARCGLFAAEWQKDVRVLGPGERVRLDYFPFHEFPAKVELDRVRIVAHYAYGERARDPSRVPASLRAMPAYAIASNSLELEVARPYELEVRLRGAWPDEPAGPLAEYFQVTLRNRTSQPLPYESPDNGASLGFELELADGRSERFSVENRSVDVAQGTLPPGDTRSLLGSESRAVVGASFPARASVSRFRARYELWFDDADSAERRAAWGPNQRVVWSDWVSLD